MMHVGFQLETIKSLLLEALRAQITLLMAGTPDREAFEAGYVDIASDSLQHGLDDRPEPQNGSEPLNMVKFGSENLIVKMLFKRVVCTWLIQVMS